MCLWPLHKLNRVTRVIADTYQSVSGTGTAAVLELESQSRAWAAGREGCADDLSAPDRLQPAAPHRFFRRFL